MVQRRRSNEYQENPGEERLGRDWIDVRPSVIEPGGERSERRDKREQREPAPVAERRQREHEHVDQQHVDNDVVAGACALSGRLIERPYDERSEKRSRDANNSERRRLVPQRQRCGPHADERQHSNGGIDRDKVVEGVGREHRQVEYGDPAARERLRVDGISLAPVLASANQGQTAHDTQQDALGLSNPIVVEGQLQEEGRADDQCQDTDAGEPVAAENHLPIDGVNNAAPLCSRRGLRCADGSRPRPRCACRSYGRTRRFARLGRPRRQPVRRHGPPKLRHLGAQPANVRLQRLHRVIRLGVGCGLLSRQWRSAENAKSVIVGVISTTCGAAHSHTSTRQQ